LKHVAETSAAAASSVGTFHLDHPDDTETDFAVN
jgi:hypothetical protein